MSKKLSGLFLLALPMLFLSCQRDNQNASNAIAGVNAIKIKVEDPAVHQIADGVILYTKAIVHDADLPAPEITPEAIVADPPKYVSQATDALEASRGGLLNWLLGAAGIAFPVIALLLTKALPWTDPLIRIANNFLLSKRGKAAAQKEVELRDAANSVLDAYRSMPNGKAKDAINKYIPVETFEKAVTNG